MLYVEIIQQTGSIAKSTQCLSGLLPDVSLAYSHALAAPPYLA